MTEARPDVTGIRADVAAISPRRRGGFLSAPSKVGKGRRPWYRRRRYQLLIAVVIVGLAVLSDRYDTYSSPQRAAKLTTLYDQVRGDLYICNGGLGAVLGAWHRLGPAPSPAEAARVAKLAKQAEANCTPTTSDVYDLVSIQVPGALSSYPKLTLAVYSLGTWAYPHAATVLLDVEQLAMHPGDKATAASLASNGRAMAADESSAAAIFGQVASDLGTHLAPLGLTAVR
ncbi:MAG: hypothetical protein ACRDZQ_08700 [Acidimicrobiales bacterium]